VRPGQCSFSRCHGPGHVQSLTVTQRNKNVFHELSGCASSARKHLLYGGKHLQGPPQKTGNLRLLTIKACGVSGGSSPELKGNHVEEADLDRAPDALEVLRHVQWQDDILLQDPLGLCQTSYVIPGHARACIQHVPTMQTCAAGQSKQTCAAGQCKQIRAAGQCKQTLWKQMTLSACQRFCTLFIT